MPPNGRRSGSRVMVTKETSRSRRSKDIDRFFDEQAPGGKPKPRGLLSHHFGMQTFALGAYVGETIRRQRDGEWRGNDNDPEAEITLAVRLKSGSYILANATRAKAHYERPGGRHLSLRRSDTPR